ncbi:hypothetical protein QJQ45_012422 [Haematococcus lacustris]|nr:hypothetical protein QJQ45_012422 [Haematococcus lacustris]
MAEPGSDLYAVLDVPRSATDIQVRRAFRTLATKLHPDRAAAPPDAGERFRALQQAYEVLGDPLKRKLYDATGTWQRGADEEFMDAFAGEGALFNADSAAALFGVTRSSYDALPLPALDVCAVRCSGSGPPGSVLGLVLEALPAALEWGQVLVEWRYAPINPGDLYSARLGGVYGSDSAALPYVAGHDGVGTVLRVGPGASQLVAGDLVLPARTFLGTWRSLAVLQEADLMRLPPAVARLVTDPARPPLLPPPAPQPDRAAGSRGEAEGHDLQSDQGQARGEGAGGQGGSGLGEGEGVGGAASAAEGGGSGRVGLEALAMIKEAAVAYLLLEKFGQLQASGGQGGCPGDCVLLNAPGSSVGQAVLQLARLLKLRVVAVARRPPGPAAAAHAGSTPAPRPAHYSASAWPAPPAASHQGGPEEGGAAGVGGEGGGCVEGSWQRTQSWLQGLGATLVVPDEGSIRVTLEGLKFFARPRLALDAVGGDSAVRLADALGPEGTLVVYGCMSGRAPTWPWQAWVFNGLKVSGFNLRRWMASGGAGGAAAGPSPPALGLLGGVGGAGGAAVASPAGVKKLMGVVEALVKLMDAGLLTLSHTEYELGEFSEALDHAQAPSGRTTKVLLRMRPGGV